MRKSTEERFWERVDKRGPDDCWMWTSYALHGYGQFFYNGTSVRSHRFVYELCVGPIPDGLYVCHKCDMPGCVNPAHLFLGTPADNMTDMMAKGRHRYRRSCGERHGKSKLTAKDVREIRIRYAKGGISQMALGREYGVSDTQIWRIVHRKRWKHI